MPPRTGQRDKGNSERKSGFKPFTSRPTFGGRGIGRSIPTANKLREKVLAKKGTVVIGAGNMNPTKQNLSYWMLGENDTKLFNALFTKYEELEPQYNACKPKQRMEWNNRVTCNKAFFCLNAIYRTQGVLDARLENTDPDRGTSENPLKSKTMPWGPGPRLIMERIGSETDLMYGWWFDEDSAVTGCHESG